MSELKAIRSGEIYNIIEYEDCYRTDDLYYPKSEADKEIAEKDKEIAELKEERRWRKFSEEKPENNGIYIVLLGEHTRTLDVYDTDKGKFRTYMPTAWKPLPSAPKEQA